MKGWTFDQWHGRRGVVLSVAGCLVLGAALPTSHADEPVQGTVLVSVDAVQLNNRGNPSGYRKELIQFKVMNLETRKKFAEPPSSDRYPSLLRLPPGTYCLYSVQTYANEELTFCKQPYFEVKPDRISNIGQWRIGVSYDGGGYRLMHAFDDQDVTERQARERYPELFGTEGAEEPATK